MSLGKSTLVSTVLLFLVFFEGRGQAAKSPFSAFGLGEYFGNALTHNQGMGGVGVSTPDYWHLNNQNPALLVYNSLTVFEAGYIGEKRTVKGTGPKEKSGSGNLNYLAMGFPVKRAKWSMGLGLMPYTNVNYRINSVAPIEGSTNTVNVTESGSGGINQFYMSNGVVINSDWSVGLKTTYFFSSIINEFNTTLTETPQLLQISTNIFDRQSFQGFGFSAGVSYHKDSLFSKKNYQINVGAVYDFKANIDTEFFERFERRNLGGIIDSVTLINNIPGTTTLPASFSIGASLSRGLQWTVGADYTVLDFSQFRDFNGNNINTKDGWQLALGGKITPDPRSVTSYLKRVTYRTGLSLAELPFLINGNTVKDFGINFGLSLPVSRVSSLDFAVKFGKRGDSQKNTLEENYFKLYFGMTFNDQWFVKRRFD